MSDIGGRRLKCVRRRGVQVREDIALSQYDIPTAKKKITPPQATTRIYLLHFNAAQEEQGVATS